MTKKLNSCKKQPMDQETKEKQALLEELREEMEKLLCSDDVSEDEKVDRMNKALAIIEGDNCD